MACEILHINDYLILLLYWLENRYSALFDEFLAQHNDCVYIC